MKRQKIGSGLLHSIFRDGDSIIKVPKPTFHHFNEPRHFLVESGIYGILNKNKLTTVNSAEVSYVDGRWQLRRSYIDARQYKKSELTQKQLAEFVRVLDSIHAIKLEGYGFIDDTLKGSSRDWHSFITQTLNVNLEYCSSNHIQVDSATLRQVIKELLLRVPALPEPALLATDINPGNVFFKRDKIETIIDIDHPLCGDAVYEYACLKSYFPKLYRYVSSTKRFSEHVHTIIGWYQLHFDLSTAVFSHKQGLSYENTVSRLNRNLSIHRENLTRALLIVKPEAYEHAHLVARELERRQFTIKNVYHKKGFAEIAYHMYVKDFGKHASQFIDAYESLGKDKFAVIEVTHHQPGVHTTLKKQVGHFSRFSSEPNSLRYLFGTDVIISGPPDSNLSVAFNGIHCTDCLFELEEHLKILKIQ